MCKFIPAVGLQIVRSRRCGYWVVAVCLFLQIVTIAAVPLAVDVDNANRSALVLADDTKLQPPQPVNGRILAPITAYHWRGYQYFPDERYELPIYLDINRDNTDFWNYLHDELLLSRVPVVMFHSRGCWEATGDSTDGQGDLCPRQLRNWLAAIDRLESTGITSYQKVGCFIATGVYYHYTGEDRFDVSNKKNWKYFWQHSIKIFFEEIPKRMWYRHNGRPVVAFWNLRDSFFVNQAGNASRMLQWISNKFQGQFGVQPFFLLQDDWLVSDPSLKDSGVVGGVHKWFDPLHDVASSIYSYNRYQNEDWGVIAPSFRSGGTDPGCGTQCREVSRRNGKTLKAALDKGKQSSGMSLLEGWIDMAEAAGFYRSNDWAYPTQYINIVRRFADPEPATLLLQAEGADEFSDKSQGNAGTRYADRDLDVGRLDGEAGWYVGWVERGEWFQYNSIQLGCGHYRITARVATGSDDRRFYVKIGNERLSTVRVPNMGGIDVFDLVHVGEVELSGGSYDVRVVFLTDDSLNVDYIFIRRTAQCKCKSPFKSLQQCLKQLPGKGQKCDPCVATIIEKTKGDRKVFQEAVCPAIKSDCPCNGCRDHYEKYVKCYSKEALGRRFKCCQSAGQVCKTSADCCNNGRCRNGECRR